ncbi:efflux RND transporter periplasmic adaptor subunit [Methylobacillus flagellatus]|uniref:Uncharacterized protein n=1 Tax=Methylobacillus flagellatus (strain ATCC 51484 / DSM 6875 / VKM B-1610 / KT) TaxID=265072 RepID=Q1H0T8_METFK|nr:hypothetical protein [Methylobacillus flagellatus]ABE49899.1 conserved hypothetical protein [Methylobacillus flagellatus KT]
MSKKAVAVIIVQACMIVVLLWLLVLFSKDEFEAFNEEEEIESPHRIHTEGGISTIILSMETQQQSDIRTETLTQAKHLPILEGLGSVLSLDGLLNLRTQYMKALGDLAVAQASLVNSKNDYERLSLLNQHDRNISDRMLVAAEALYKSDLAKLQAHEAALDNLRHTARQQWGETLGLGMLEPKPSADIQALLEYRQVLLRIVLPPQQDKPTANLQVTPVGSGISPITAHLLALSPQADPVLQGKTYFYTAPAANLRAGMRLSTRELDTQNMMTGVVIPQQAVVWYGGKAWVYRKQDVEKFVREPISTEIESDNGWFNHGKLRPGDTIVTSGAQLLLSEELKYQITNENDD